MPFSEEFLTHKRRGTQGFATTQQPSPPPPPAVINYSSAPDRSNPQPLNAATLANTGPWYIFVLPESLAGPFTFNVDNGVFTHLETTAPWDLVGTNGDNTAQPYTFASTGSHNITVNTTEAVATFNITIAPAAFDYYVSPTLGNNAWNGLSPTFTGGTTGPKQTLGGATGALQLLQPGQSLGVRGGNYAEALHNPTVRSGLSANQRTRISNYNGEVVWIKPTTSFPTIDGLGPCIFRFDGYQGTTWAWIEFDGINLDGSSAGFNYSGCLSLVGRIAGDVRDIRWKNSEFIGKNGAASIGNIFSGPSSDSGEANQNVLGRRHEFINLNVHGGGMNNGPGPLEQGRFQHAFYAFGSELLVQNCIIWDFTGVGLHIFRNASAKGTGIRLVGNTIHSARTTGEPSPGHAGIVDEQDGTLTYNNVIYNMHATGDGSNAVGIGISGINAQCHFNTIVNSDKMLDGFGSGSGNVCRNNLGWQNTTTESIANQGTISQSNNSFGTTNPQFVNIAGGNFHLTPSTPPSIQTGGIAITSPTAITTDKDGVPRPNPPSIGAYQP